MTRRLAALTLVAAPLLVVAADSYSGPRPPKQDVPYLLHATNLVETETGSAREEKRKDGTAYVTDGASSPAKTPLAEPIFLFAQGKISPERLQLYRMEVKNGKREVFVPEKRKKDNRPLYLTVSRVADGLYRVEANETLENGEYALTPDGSNQVFLFQVY